MRATPLSSSKKRIKGYFRVSASILLGVVLCSLIAFQLMIPAPHALPMWLFGLACLALVYAIADTGLGARRDFDEAVFLDSQTAQAKARELEAGPHAPPVGDRSPERLGPRP